MGRAEDRTSPKFSRSTPVTTGAQRLLQMYFCDHRITYQTSTRPITVTSQHHAKILAYLPVRQQTIPTEMAKTSSWNSRILRFRGRVSGVESSSENVHTIVACQ